MPPCLILGAFLKCAIAKIGLEKNKVSQGFEALARAQCLLRSKISLGKMTLLSQVISFPLSFCVPLIPSRVSSICLLQFRKDISSIACAISDKQISETETLVLINPSVTMSHMAKKIKILRVMESVSRSDHENLDGII